MSGERPHCMVIGVGAGTGAACARRFSEGGYTVSMVARSPERLARFADDIPHTVPYPVDISDIEAWRSTLRRMAADLGLPRVVIYNATLASFGRYEEVAIGDFERNFRVNAAGLLATAQELGPAMSDRGEGAIIVTGNTGSLRGSPDYVGWSPTKAAQRILSECLARELGPRGVHVAYVVIDAIIDMPFARRRRPGLPDEAFARPEDLAAEIWHVAHQPRSAWSFLVELRPFGERW